MDPKHRRRWAIDVCVAWLCVLCALASVYLLWRYQKRHVKPETCKVVEKVHTIVHVDPSDQNTKLISKHPPLPEISGVATMWVLRASHPSPEVSRHVLGSMVKILWVQENDENL